MRKFNCFDAMLLYQQRNTTASSPHISFPSFILLLSFISHTFPPPPLCTLDFTKIFTSITNTLFKVRIA